MQNFEMNRDEIVNRGRLSMPYSASSKLCWVDYRDVAEVAAMAMVGDELSYGTFELCAPGLLDLTEIAAIAANAFGRQVDAGETSAEQMASWLPEDRLRDGMRRMIAHYDSYGLPGGNALVLRAILGREPRTLENFFQELASRG
jgi:uncharacterized protein YbjT (DUF2867 family)